MDFTESKKTTWETEEPQHGTLTRAKSRNKGINFNTVSPALHQQKRSVSHTQEGFPTRSTAKREAEAKLPHRLNYEFTLPNAELLSALSVDEQLRLLALKEMAVVEIKDGISDLEHKLHSTELDLSQLRRLIQRSLYQEMTAAKTQLAPNKHTVGTCTEKTQPSVSPYDELDRLTKIWANLAKPITFIQLLDSLIQNEIEKSLAAEDAPPLPHSLPCSHKPKQSPRTKARRDAPRSAVQQPLKDTTNITAPEGSQTVRLPYQDSSEDMFQAVSSSLWTFVNDMKTNMLSSLNDAHEPDVDPSAKLADSDRVKEDSKQDELDLIDLSSGENHEEPREDEEDIVDLTMYSSMRRKKAPR